MSLIPFSDMAVSLVLTGRILVDSVVEKIDLMVVGMERDQAISCGFLVATFIEEVEDALDIEGVATIIQSMTVLQSPVLHITTLLLPVSYTHLTLPTICSV